jgi:hypothetical protein
MVYLFVSPSLFRYRPFLFFPSLLNPCHLHHLYNVHRQIQRGTISYAKGLWLPREEDRRAVMAIYLFRFARFSLQSDRIARRKGAYACKIHIRVCINVRHGFYGVASSKIYTGYFLSNNLYIFIYVRVYVCM